MRKIQTRMKTRRKITVIFCGLIFIAACVWGSFFAVDMITHYRAPVKFEKEVIKYAKEYNVDENLIFAIIKTESNFIFDASSNKNAKGLMQLMDDTATWVADKMKLEDFSKEDITNPKTNIAMGTWYISYLIEKYHGEVEVALAAYNAGPGNVDRWLSDGENSSDGKTLDYIPYKETRNYVEKVTNAKKEYEKLRKK